MRPLRVTHMCGGQLNGCTRVVLNLLAHHDRRRFSPSVFFNSVMDPDPLVIAEIERLGVEWRSVTKRSRYDLTAVFRAASTLRALATELLVTHGFGAYSVGTPAALLARIPAVVRVEHNAELYTALHRLAARITAPAATSTILVSRYLVRYLEEQGVRPPRPEVIYNGIELAPYVAVRRHPFEGQSPTTILMIARMDHNKDQGTLLEAVALLRKRGRSVRLLLAHTGPLEAALRAHARTLGIDDLTTFLGFQPNTEKLLETADISVLATNAEGFGLVVVEAMAAARPVVATDIGPIPEILDSNEHGVLVPPKSPVRLADALEQLLKDPVRARAIGAAAREVALARYGIESAVLAHERHLLRAVRRAEEATSQ